MSTSVLTALGGIGLILLGIIIMTEGLRALAGDRLRRWLSRFTRNAVSGVLTGAGITAILQSSGAVTVATVGLVGGGALSFIQAVGIVFGANIGTTVTGWLVALFGFKFAIAAPMLALIAAGALVRRFGRGKVAHAGFALAGFGLLFLGLDTLKSTLETAGPLLEGGVLPGNSWGGRLALMGTGVAMTIVTQSSSAGVATTLAALNAGVIGLPQAAALVIGMDVGTTVSALVAAIGGSTAMRRTGAAHVTLNLITAMIAYAALDPMLALAERITGDSGELALVGFHTGFNVVGILIVLPFVTQFAALIERMVPERGVALLAGLDERLLPEAGSAVDAATATLGRIAVEQAGLLGRFLTEGRATTDRGMYAPVGEALAATRLYLDRIATAPSDTHNHDQQRAAMHVLDHQLRLHRRLGQELRIEALDDEPKLAQMARMLARIAERIVETGDIGAQRDRLGRLQRHYAGNRDSYRAMTITEAATGSIGADAAMLRLDGIRWLDRVAYHFWRIAVNLGTPAGVEPADTDDFGD